jgi:drug/metabolite transporter (DMT)-like permease
MTAATLSPQRMGVLLVLNSALCWSFAGLFAKLVTTDPWTATCFRAIVAAAFLGLVFISRQGRNSADVLWRTVWAAPAAIITGAASMVVLIAAYYATTVANVSVIYATAPFWAAGLAWLLAGETPDRRTLIASAVALAGVVIVVGGSFRGANLAGDGLAVLMTVLFVLSSIYLRGAPLADTVAVSLSACILCALATAPLADMATLKPADMLWLTLFGITSSGIAYITFMAGARLISPTEAGLISAAEVPLAPLWVFLVLGEKPALTSYIGGAVVLAAVLGHLALQARSTPTGAVRG